MFSWLLGVPTAIQVMNSSATFRSWPTWAYLPIPLLLFVEHKNWKGNEARLSGIVNWSLHSQEAWKEFCDHLMLNNKIYFKLCLGWNINCGKVFGEISTFLLLLYLPYILKTLTHIHPVLLFWNSFCAEVIYCALWTSLSSITVYHDELLTL